MTTSSQQPKTCTFNLHYPRTWRTALNPRSAAAARRTEAWLRQIGVIADGTSAATFRALAASGFGGWPFPSADVGRLETIISFLTLWIFFDDRIEGDRLIDERRFQKAIHGAADEPQDDNLLRGWWQLAPRYRLMGRSWNDRLAQRFGDWLGSVPTETELLNRYRDTGEHPSIQDYMTMRRVNIGVFPALSFVEYCLGQELPWDVQQHPLLRTLEVLATEVVIWSNDLCGFSKDREAGWLNAASSLAADTGLSMPEAFERATMLHNLCVRDIARLEAELLSTVSDRPLVEAWLDGLHHMLYGFARWQETAPRYSALHEVEGCKIRVVADRSTSEHRLLSRPEASRGVRYPLPADTP